MIHTLLLDLDGPLLDGKIRHYQCYANILTGNGYKPMPIDDFWEMKRRRASRTEILAASGAEEIYDIFLKEWLNNIEKKEYLELDKVQQNATSKLHQWKEAGFQIILVTMRRDHDSLENQLHSTGLLPYLDSMVISKHENGGVGKALAVLKKIPNIKKSCCLWIGDTEADVEGARYMGCPIWTLSCGIRTKEYLQSLHPDYLSNSITDVTL